MSSKDKPRPSTGPIEIRRRWHRLLLTDGGVSINGKPPIPWDDVVAVGPSVALSTALFSLVLRGAPLTRPVLHVCVRGDPYPRPAAAVTFRYRTGRETQSEKSNARDRGVIENAFGPWCDRVPIIAPVAFDLGVWWFAQPASRPRPAPPAPREPTTHERAEKMHHELEKMNRELRDIERRRKFNL